MAIFQIKVEYLSRNKNKKNNKKNKGQTGKNLNYISRGKASSGQLKKSLEYIARENDYSDRDDLLHYEEKNVPKEFEDGKDFVDTMEKNSRSNARFLKKYEMSLPREFSDKENIKIAQEFCEQKLGKDYTYFMAVHNPTSKSDGLPHPHLHLSFCERKLDGLDREKEKYFKNANKKNPDMGGIGVNREMATREYFDKFCKDWENHLNKHLVKNGYEKLNPKKDKFEVENKTLKEEKIRSYSKEQIEKMDPREVGKILLDSEKKIHENEKKIKRLYQKNIEREVLNEVSGNKLYKLENKIRQCEISKKNSNFSTKERGEYLRQEKALKVEREKLVNDCKGSEKYFTLKKKKESEKKAELKKLNTANAKLKRNVEKIIKTKSIDEMKNVKDNLKKNKSVNVEKNARTVNQKNKIKKNQNTYTAGEKKNINYKYQNTMSKTMQVMRLISKINVLKNLGKEEQGNATQMINMKVGKKYERLKKGGILSEDLQEEKTQNQEQIQEQNQEQSRGKVRTRTR